MFLDVCQSALDEKIEMTCLKTEQKDDLMDLLKDFWSLFNRHMGHTSVGEHKINTGDAKPVHLPPYWSSPAKKQIIEDQIQMMLKEDSIKPVLILAPS